MRLLYINFTLFLSLLMNITETSFINNLQETELTIVGNAKSVPTDMDLDQLKSVLKGEKLRWDDGSKVIIALMKTDTPIGMNTSKELFNMTGNQLNKHFLALVFQGKVKAPTFFDSEDELEAYVAHTPGAIGVIQKVNDAQLNTIMVVKSKLDNK